ncbi:hypothetical protein BT93_E0969 [Corymbia citriodora subsp. variegata]|nr:hypothetical protein BT93_E0969 [Corymbia citriodora subsp. variegata]
MLCALILFLAVFRTSFVNALCHADESSALMEFKRSFRTSKAGSFSIQPGLYSGCVYPKVESWSLDEHGDCCLWDGVECDEATGHVIGLDLSNSCLFGTITSNSSLFHLHHLESLNLAWNDFNSTFIPYGLGNLSGLHYLNLSGSYFSGKIPSDISQLSKLISLDLSFAWVSLPNINNFVQNLTMLRELDLSYTNITSPFPKVVANFSSLKSLKLIYCQLQGEFPVSIFHLPNLEVLDISDNANLSAFIPEQHWGSRLKSLSLHGTDFSGEIPISIGNLVVLNELSIGDCHFSGSLPTSLGNLSQLTFLDMSSNKLQGHIPASFANLTQLSTLYLRSNNFSGDTLHWLVNLAKLTYLELSDAQLSGPILSSFENLTRLVELDLSSNHLQGEIPNSLWELKDLEYLDLSRNNLSGTMDLHKLRSLRTLNLNSNNISFASKTKMNVTLPNLSTLILDSCNLHEFPKFLGYLSGLEWVDFSHNKIRGSTPTWMGNGSRESLWYMDLSHNFLSGFGNKQINLPLPKLTYFDISSNLLTTKLPTPPPSVTYFNISNNILSGEIQSVCRARSLFILDLSNNNLSGAIPSCLGNMDSLSILDLGKNKLEGMIPQAYPKGCALKSIVLTENRLQGSIPRSLANCTMLEYLNLGYNQILGEFPSWLSQLTKLKAIILKSNKFHGPIEAYQSQYNFSNLHIMDLSSNSFTGEFPSKLLQSFHAMEVVVNQEQLEYMNTFEVIPSSLSTVARFLYYGMKLTNKGTEREYSKVPFALMQIDLSNNKFEGQIPDLIGDLKSLVLLNLSNNILSSSIPPSLANLTRLESLDLSQNKLSGEIPQQLTKLTFLSFFNVSHNQLLGPIPRGSQFNTFAKDSFSMNEGLCGSPLPKKCTTARDKLPIPPSLKEEIGEESSFNLDWTFVLIGIGMGFLIGMVLGNLIIDEKSRWFLRYSERMAKGWIRMRRQ